MTREDAEIIMACAEIVDAVIDGDRFRRFERLARNVPDNSKVSAAWKLREASGLMHAAVTEILVKLEQQAADQAPTSRNAEV